MEVGEEGTAIWCGCMCVNVNRPPLVSHPWCVRHLYSPHFAFGKQVNAVWKTTLSCPPNNQGTAVGSARAEVGSERPPEEQGT